MPLDQNDLDRISALIDANSANQARQLRDEINRAVSGGPVVQVTPRDLAYLGFGQYVSETKGRMYRKSGRGGIVDAGVIPEPV